jgi:hypothetical protein
MIKMAAGVLNTTEAVVKPILKFFLKYKHEHPCWERIKH